jgi:chemotaxis protein methyltransferase CheR
MDTMTQIASLVGEHSGLQLSPDDDRLGRIVRERLQALQLGSIDDYARLLTSDLGELGILAAARTINESYFFRDRGQLHVIEHVLLPKIRCQHEKSRRLRIWCAGCSTGEEAYTLAIMARRAIPEADTQIEIVATDIDRNALDWARRGRYEAWSFRGVTSEDRSRYFEQDGSTWRVAPEIRACVRFHQHNLAHDAIPAIHLGIWQLDLIVCRNVFIYFDHPTVTRISSRMHDALAPEGGLVTGHAELLGHELSGFESQAYDQSMVYQRRPSSKEHHHPMRVTPPPPQARSDRLSPDPSVPSESPDGSDLIEKARQLADTGDLEAAADMARQALEDREVDALFLLAQISFEQGSDAHALETLRKCLYLAPDYIPAYLEMGTVLESTGAVERARSLYRTALRLLTDCPGNSKILPDDDRTAEAWIIHLKSKFREA